MSLFVIFFYYYKYLLEITLLKVINFVRVVDGGDKPELSSLIYKG